MLTAPFPQGRLVPVEAVLDLVIRLLRDGLGTDMRKRSIKPRVHAIDQLTSAK
jgi:hypothetical protein